MTTSDLTTIANVALRTLMEHAKNPRFIDQWNAAYFLGRLDTIEIYMEPDPELLADAKAVVGDLAAKARLAELPEAVRAKITNQQDQG